MNRHTIIAWMEDKPGVLNRVAGLFRRRNFNIESLVVGHSETPGISRMTFVAKGDGREMRQIQAQLDKLINVTRIEDVTHQATITRELALIKVEANSSNRHEIVQMAELHRAEIIDVTIDSVIVQIVGGDERVNSLIENLRHFGIIEMVRTGSVAMVRSPIRKATGEKQPAVNGHA